MRNRIVRVILLLSFAFLFVFSSCSSMSGPKEKEEAASVKADSEKSGENTKTKGKQTKSEEETEEEKEQFVYCITPQELSFDPLHSFTTTEAQVYTALYEGLVTYNPFTLKPSPGIAKRWEKSENGTVYKFYIRENARYNNGDYITAAHVRDTFLKLIDPEENAEYAGLFDVVKNAEEYRKGNISDPDKVGITAEEKRVVRFELEHPANHFLKILCHHSFTPLHPKMRENPEWNKPESLIQNGPFYIAEHTENYILLKKNELYWDRETVKLDSIRVTFREDKAEITKDFNKGKIHWTEAPVEYEKIADREAIVVNNIFATSYYFFSTRQKPFDNPAIRRALALILPWDKIRSSEYMYMPTSTLVPKISSYPDIDGITEQNTNRAMELLSKEGFSGGTGLPKIRIHIPHGEESRRIAEEMAGAWRENLDVEVSITETDFSSYEKELRNNPFTIGTFTWIGDFADPLTFLNMWTSGSNLNLAEYSQPEYEKLIKESLSQTGEERYKTMSEAEKILLSGAVVLPVSHSPAFNVIDINYVEGWFPNPLDIHPFKYLGFGEAKIPEGVVRSHGGAFVPFGG